MTVKFSIKTTHEASDLVANILFELGGSGVCITDPSDFDEIDKNGVVWDYIDQADKVGDVIVEGFFDSNLSKELFALLNQKLDFLRANCPFDCGALTACVLSVDDSDWLSEWKRFYKPIVLNKIAIYPSWIKPEYNGAVVKIEPGCAFGTGEHESTRMCLELLEELPVKGAQVADVGCGSGILGMAALKLGAEQCYFCDIDANALENLKVNLELNDISAYELRVASLLEGYQEKSDFIFANITADILIRLAPQIPSRLNDKGVLLLSGVIAEREEEVISAYFKQGLVVEKSLKLRDWRAYKIVKA